MVSHGMVSHHTESIPWYVKPPISSCKLLLYQLHNEYVKFSYIPLCSLCVGQGGQGRVLINLVKFPFLLYGREPCPTTHIMIFVTMCTHAPTLSPPIERESCKDLQTCYAINHFIQGSSSVLQKLNRNSIWSSQLRERELQPNLPCTRFDSSHHPHKR